MGFKFGGLFAAFTFFLCVFGYSQTPSSIIRGTVFTQNNLAAGAATVILLNRRDSSIVSSALTDNKGVFELNTVKPGSYLLLTTSLGYQKNYSGPYLIKAGENFIAKAIFLIPLNKEIAEVSVIGKKQFVEIKPGKTIINPQASIAADGKNVLDILRQLPGVRVDNNDNVSIIGRQNALVLIDGKTTGLTGDDLTALLKSTQGTNIDRMELITAGSSKYDAAAGGIINIVFKKGKNIGTNGTFTAGAGFGSYQRLNTGITFNSRSNRFNIFGGYNVNDNKNYYNFTNNRNVNYANILSNYNSVYNSIQGNVSQQYRIGADYRVSAGETIGFLVYGSVSNNTITKNNSLKILNQGNLDSVVYVNANLRRNFNYINYNLNYTSKLNDAGSMLTANTTYSPYSRNSNEYIINNFLNGTGAPYRNAMLLQNLSPSNRRNFTSALDYTSPLSKKSTIEAGVKYSDTKSDNNLMFGPKVGNQYIIDANFSNLFIYQEKVSHLYLNFNGTYGKYGMQLGLRGEFTSSNANSVTLNQIIKRNYFNLFPSIAFSYHHSDKNEYSLSFGRAIQRPSYDGLNPFLYYVDPYNYQTGNPYLKPEYTDVLRLTHIYNQTVSTTLYINFVTDANFSFYQQNDNSKVAFLTSRNLGKIYNYGIIINTPVRFFNWWNADFNLDASYQRYQVYPQFGTFDKNTGDLIFTSSQNFSITKALSAEISGKYESATYYGITKYDPVYNVDAGISQVILNKKGKISLTASDIFNTLKTRAYFNFQNVDVTNIVKRESRFLKLNFTYNFGKTSVKGSRARNTGNEEEQNRMRKSAN